MKVRLMQTPFGPRGKVKIMNIKLRHQTHETWTDCSVGSRQTRLRVDVTASPPYQLLPLDRDWKCFLLEFDDFHCMLD